MELLLGSYRLQGFKVQSFFDRFSRLHVFEKSWDEFVALEVMAEGDPPATNVVKVGVSRAHDSSIEVIEGWKEMIDVGPALIEALREVSTHGVDSWAVFTEYVLSEKVGIEVFVELC